MVDKDFKNNAFDSLDFSNRKLDILKKVFSYYSGQY